jgi:hypothetical protein
VQAAELGVALVCAYLDWKERAGGWIRTALHQDDSLQVDRSVVQVSGLTRERH